MLGTIRYNLSNLTNFRGRESRGQFWPYAAFVFILAMIGIAAVMLPAMSDSMTRMQRFAAEHPDLATVQSGPGSYSVSIQGKHPELMPDMRRIMAKMDVAFAIVIGLLAAAIARRLHDRGKSGYWGLLPVPFLAFASIAMPRVFAQNPPDMNLFFLMFFNNLAYIACLITLVVLLAGESKNYDNIA